MYHLSLLKSVFVSFILVAHFCDQVLLFVRILLCCHKQNYGYRQVTCAQSNQETDGSSFSAVI